MEYKYYREPKHNYLVVKSIDEAADNKESYQVRILENRNLKGFLPCNIRTINNEQFLYYEINSMQSLKDRYSSKGMDRQQLIALFNALKNSLERLSEYLLGIENVILDTKSIFTDLNSGEFMFMYYPFSKEESDFSAFIDELFDLVDHEDEKALEIVYACSENAQNDSCLVLDLISNVLKDFDDSPEDEDTEELVRVFQPVNEDDTWEDDDEEEELSEPSEKKDKKRIISMKMDSKVQLLFAVAFFILVGVMVYIRKGYILTKEENILSIIVMIVSMFTGLVAFLSAIKDMLKPSSQSDAKDPSEDKKDSESAFMDESVDLSSYRQTILVTPSSEMKEARSSAMNISEKAMERTMSKVKEKAADYGETVVLDQEDEERGITLYSRNADKTIRIPLDLLPLTIGKMEGCVDKVIGDKSISRIHCRFDRSSDGRISLIDLNSTNGTYKNGLKLSPQETNYIEEGDEIRIGRICFDCR